MVETHLSSVAQMNVLMTHSASYLLHACYNLLKLFPDIKSQKLDFKTITRDSRALLYMSDCNTWSKISCHIDSVQIACQCIPESDQYEPSRCRLFAVSWYAC